MDEGIVMRYYKFLIKTTAAQIKENTKVNLREYDYSSPVAAVNNYMYKKLKNDTTFFVYREEQEYVAAVFSYNERKYSLDDTYHDILEMLDETFAIKKVKEEPIEITMYDFLEYLYEAKRREYIITYNRIIDNANLWLFGYYKNEPKTLHYEFKEKIILDNKEIDTTIYDKNFIKELLNIESHENLSRYKGNMVHYVISSRSLEATSDMTEILIKYLINAKRISSRRMEIISSIEPDIYKVNNHLEDIIENNYGGVVVFDLSEKFGYDPVDYKMASEYIEKLVKKYRNDCLFVFTYNIEKPGFAYFILPNMSKYVIPVVLREGSGDRTAAINYMKKLIRNSEYCIYAEQADEFMNLFPGNQFSQTDVLMAYEKFEPWCLNKNVLKAYEYNVSDEFMLDRDENIDSAYDKLEKLIGLSIVKEQINNIIATDIVEKERKKRSGNSYKTGTMHMVFSGNPGSAKTSVAKLFASIARERGLLKSGIFVECGGMDLDGIGGIWAIREAFLAAKGGVLFIDEAYSLKSDVAVTTLIQEMENQREETIVILAGYNERMKNFMELNEGLKSRIPYWIDFPDYDAEELTDIFKLMIKERGFCVTEEALNEAHYIFEKVRFRDNFGNGRYVRNLLERATQRQSVRLFNVKNQVSDISRNELFLITKEDISMLEDGLRNERPVGTAQRELEEMIGLTSVKNILRKAIASFKLKKLCENKGISKERASLHMVFTGNPGTAKTTVARLFAEIMKDEKVLPTGNFVEVGRADLVGDHVGATAPLVKKKFKEAQGGVLFIDEAYSLCDSYENGFGDEAINTLVSEMENCRHSVIVIFAGYPLPMKQFLDRNPGMSSRIAFQVDFKDYSIDELCEITNIMLRKKEFTITSSAMKKLRKNYECVINHKDYGNGRYVRKVLEEVEMNMAERISYLEDMEITVQLLTTIEECDVPEVDIKEIQKKRIGFCA